MRNIFLKISICCLILFTISCAKTTEHINILPDSFMKVKIDGVWFESEMPTAVIMEVSSKKTMQIIGGKGKYEVLSFMLDNYIGVGTYNLSNENITTFADTRKPLESYFATKGKLIITSATEKAITGTFEFEATNYNDNSTKTFKEGSFVISIPDPKNNPSVPVNPGNSNMKAKIDNVSISFTGEASLLKITQPFSVNDMVIHGMNDKKMLSINISDYKGVGTYEINGQTGHMILYSLDYSQNAGDYAAISGKIVVTSSTSNSLKGTFEFVGEKNNNASNKITVKEGTFEMGYKTTSM
jgi:Family of unknown function (DUF6252)